MIYLPTAAGLMPIAAHINGRLYAIHTDHLNTPRRLTNAQGQVAWQWLVTGFGEVNPTTGAGGYLQQGNGYTYSEPVTFHLRYPGQQWDEETGLAYNLHRYYDAQNGRYIQADPIGLEGGWNRFAYVEGNPLLFIDPEGLRSARPAAPGGNSRNRRQWRRHGPGSFERPTGEGNRSAWESGAEMFTPNPAEGDYRLRCLRWECSENSCTPGKSPTDFLPAAYLQDDAPSGCRCTQTNLGPVFNPPQFDPTTDFPDTYDKYRRSGGQLGRKWRALW